VLFQFQRGEFKTAAASDSCEEPQTLERWQLWHHVATIRTIAGLFPTLIAAPIGPINGKKPILAQHQLHLQADA
jgi:hypothetical protein